MFVNCVNLSGLNYFSGIYSPLISHHYCTIMFSSLIISVVKLSYKLIICLLLQSSLIIASLKATFRVFCLGATVAR